MHETDGQRGFDIPSLTLKIPDPTKTELVISRDETQGNSNTYHRRIQAASSTLHQL